ncbi:MAG: SpoVT / AbrB like domain protein [Candidatus Bathyarchaeota archaeon BA2]|nr:MAG: SpoVT / AbrB like domain protein [Candidatus Bathyarchaeota archaeon BA2]
MMSYSKVTRKGQMTIPVEYRKKYNLKEGVVVAFEETEEGLIIRPVPDIADSAGALSKYGNPKELLAYLMKAREEGFR